MRLHHVAYLIAAALAVQGGWFVADWRLNGGPGFPAFVTLLMAFIMFLAGGVAEADSRGVPFGPFR